MARIVVARADEHMNRFRSISLYLNGEFLSDIDNDESISFDVDPGQHKLVAKIDWCGSQTLTFDMSESDKQTFELSGFRHNKAIMPFSVVMVTLHLIMQLFFGFQISVIFILPMVLILLYYVSIGRDHYLRLEPRDYSEEYSPERV